MKILVAVLACVLALCGGQAVAAPASPGPSASAAPAASPDAAVLARAQSWLGMMQSGKIDRTQLTPEMNAAMTDASVTSLAGEIAPFGAPTSFTQSRIVHGPTYTAYVYAVTFKNGTKALMIFSLDDATGKVGGLRLTPSE
ncbi:MAG TPA: hypothetical protein VMW12_12710 [Candidatus Dormibacteraeota bacterium]|nr:hypothetical protein [Candidatus Dormibacteraeota bacterium]